MSLERYLLLSLFYTDKIFFETPISTGFWLESTHFLEVGLEWEHEIIHIFSDEYFEYEIPSLLQKYLRNFENGKIELYRSILIHSCHTCSRWSDI